MRTNYLQWMLAIYVGLGVVIGFCFSAVLNLFIPIPQDLFSLFMIASVAAGILLGIINYFVFYFFTKRFTHHFNGVLRSVRNGDLSARSTFNTRGIIGELNTNINKTIANLERIQILTLHDDLTGLSNRQALERFFFEKEQEADALLFIDVNGFKQINDTFGHVTGDEVLRYIAFVLNDAILKRGRVYRLSGDEFVIIRTGRGDVSCQSLCEDIHQAFREPFHTGNEEIQISLSIGVSSFVFGQKDLMTILDEADQEMYKMKKRYAEGMQG